MNPVRILAAHDLSGFGHTSLLAAIPLMYRMGIETAVLPTALLSANTDHPGYRGLDTTKFMEQTLQHWQEMELRFDAVYTGFLGCEQQATLLKEHIPKLKKPLTPVLIDPVLGDNGKLYACYNHTMIEAMRSLIELSNIITPNYTEAAFLLGETLAATKPDLRTQCKKLSLLGPKQVIITSAPGSDGTHSVVACYNYATDYYAEFNCCYLPVDYPGAGDCFAAMFLAATLQGHSMEIAVKGTIAFLHAAFSQSQTLVADRRSGIALAEALKTDPDHWFRT